MAMDGMGMPAMAMPGMTDVGDQQLISDLSQAGDWHPSIGDMGPCERQSCDQSSVVSVKANRPNCPQLHSIVEISQTPGAGGAPLHFRDARDGVADHGTRDGSPLQVSLRI
jgi:hypothetical protein